MTLHITMQNATHNAKSTTSRGCGFAWWRRGDYRNPDSTCCRCGFGEAERRGRFRCRARPRQRPKPMGRFAAASCARTNPSGSHPLFGSCTMKKGPDLTVGTLLHCMEARGVEPLSEDNATQVSTGVVTVLVSPSGRPVTGFLSGQPDCPLPSAPGGD